MSVTAFVGSAATGPVNSPVRVRGIAEFKRDFGALSLAHPLTYAVQQYFENGGRDALIAGAAFGVFLGVILRWRSRFRNRVQENFWVLHRLQLSLSMATLGYVSLKLLSD